MAVPILSTLRLLRALALCWLCSAYYLFAVAARGETQHSFAGSMYAHPVAACPRSVARVLCCRQAAVSWDSESACVYNVSVVVLERVFFCLGSPVGRWGASKALVYWMMQLSLLRRPASVFSRSITIFCVSAGLTLIRNASRAIVSSAPFVFSDVFALVSINRHPY